MFEDDRTVRKRIVNLVQDVLQEKLNQLRLLGDTSQFNRRIRRARHLRHTTQTTFLVMAHHRRRLARRKAIRQLVEGPVRANLKSHGGK